MQDLTGKATGSTLTATEWNQLPGEVQNVITALGIALSDSDLNQLGKAVAGYVANGTFYLDSGTVNNFVLSPVGAKQPPISYADGLEASFIAANGIDDLAFANVAGLGSRPIVRADGSGQVDGTETGDPAIASGQFVSLRYDAGSDSFVLRTAPDIVSYNALVASVASLSLNLRSFGSSGNYTPVSGVTSFIAVAIGGGGGGGGAESTDNTGANVGGGGGGGGSRFGIVTSPSGTYTVTIGASGSAGTGASDGGTGGDTTISGTGLSLTASGGEGGRTVQSNTVTDESFSSSPGGEGGSAGSGGLFGSVGGAGTRGSGVAHPLTPGAMVLTGFPSGGGSFLCPANRAEESGVTESTTGGSSIGDAGLPNTGAGGNGGINFSNSVDVQGGGGGTGFVMIIELLRD